MVQDGVVVGVTSAIAAALLVVGLSAVVGAIRAKKHGRAGPRKRAIAVLVLAIAYVVMRVLFR